MTSETDENIPSEKSSVMSGSDSDDEPADDKNVNVLPFEECLNQAMSLKEAGNEAFKNKDLPTAQKCYQDGIELLKPHKDLGGPSDDVTEEQYTSMINTFVGVQGNLCLLYFKQESWSEVVQSSADVLKYDAKNVKALYRKGVALHNLSSLDESKDCLSRALEIDPENAPAKKALVAVSKDIKAKKQKEKAALAGAFSSGSMYEDKAKERERKQRLEREAEEKLQDDYIKEKLKRREEGKEEQTFDEYKAERKKEEERQKKEMEEEKKKKSQPVSKAPKKSPPPTEDSEDEYDEEEQKILKETKNKGYCYFRNKLDEKTSELIGDIAPTPLTEPVLDNAPAPSKIEASSWNHAGTWEERDVTEITKNRLTDTCLGSTVTLSGGMDDSSLNDTLANLQTENSGDTAALTKSLENMTTMMSKVEGSITDVKSIDGEAQIVMVGKGKKRQIYDFNLSLKFEVNVHDITGDSSKNKKFKGSFEVMDVTPGSAYEHKTVFKKSGTNKKVDDAVEKLRDDTIARIHSFFENDYLKL